MPGSKYTGKIVVVSSQGINGLGTSILKVGNFIPFIRHGRCINMLLFPLYLYTSCFIVICIYYYNFICTYIFNIYSYYTNVSMYKFYFIFICYFSLNIFNIVYYIVTFITMLVFFPFRLLIIRYLDKFSELLYLPGITLVYYEERI